MLTVHTPPKSATINHAEAERTASEVEWLGLDVLSASEVEDTGRWSSIFVFAAMGGYSASTNSPAFAARMGAGCM
jgi:uncharacterized protein YchJ